MDAGEVVLMNIAIESAYSSFNQNPTYSSANAVFFSALESFPTAVTASLACSGYGGINTATPPAWLAPIPTAVVSIVLKEEAVYESIISSFIENAESGSTTRLLTPSLSRSLTLAASDSTTITISSSHMATTTPASATQSIHSSSSAGALGSSGNLASSILAVVGFIFAGLL